MALKGGNFILKAKIDIDEDKDELSGQKKSKENKKNNKWNKNRLLNKILPKKNDQFQAHIIQKINDNDSLLKIQRTNLILKKW